MPDEVERPVVRVRIDRLESTRRGEPDRLTVSGSEEQSFGLIGVAQWKPADQSGTAELFRTDAAEQDVLAPQQFPDRDIRRLGQRLEAAVANLGARYGGYLGDAETREQFGADLRGVGMLSQSVADDEHQRLAILGCREAVRILRRIPPYRM
ncbi:hypothetical protein Q5P07_26670 [Nocardia seriolae]|nr:hypothetical protein [Nocardia seriolae]WKY50574.1 hypothetical protein Q5P07_26670 [Nocardia seriolae]WNJ61442.1 hypothetical protein RMO66_12575 [Nocardia seriolae]